MRASSGAQPVANVGGALPHVPTAAVASVQQQSAVNPVPPGPPRRSPRLAGNNLATGVFPRRGDGVRPVLPGLAQTNVQQLSPGAAGTTAVAPGLRLSGQARVPGPQHAHPAGPDRLVISSSPTPTRTTNREELEAGPRILNNMH